MTSLIVPMFSAAAANHEVNLREIVAEVLDSERYVLGPKVQGFEKAFAAYLGTSHVIGVGNGTDALEIALRSLDIQPGQKVITVANAGYYASTAICAVGGEPLYVDVDPVTLLMSPDALAQALEKHRVAAVIVTHLYGRLANMDAILPLCHGASVPVIEDCAQAHGARRKGRQAGAWGDVACFSFYPTKNLGALGDGGALATSDTALAERLRTLRQYGWASKYKVVNAGGCNSRLDELQAAILLAKLPLLDAANQQRRDVGVRYNAAFRGLPLQLPDAPAEEHVYHLYVLRTAAREALQAHLLSHGIASDVHYPIPDHLQPVHGSRSSQFGLSVTEAACQQVLSLPCSPRMTEEQVSRVIAAVLGFFERTL